MKLVAILSIIFFVSLLNIGWCQSNHSSKQMIVNSLGMTMIRVTAGEFAIGAVEGDVSATDFEKPQHIVAITETFYLQATEVTFGQFQSFCNATGYLSTKEREQNRSKLGTVGTWRDTSDLSLPDCPVAMVTLEDANSFCLWLSGKEARRYRLPTESEWEYCCRAGSKSVYAGGLSVEELYSNYSIGAGDYAVRPRKSRSNAWKCGSGVANSWGFFDMHGNVFELVDGYRLSYDRECVQPSKVRLPDQHFECVVRGGSWREGPESARC